MKEYKTVKLWVETHKNLKLLATMKGLSVIKMLDEWAKKELKKEQEKK